MELSTPRKSEDALDEARKLGDPPRLIFSGDQVQFYFESVSRLVDRSFVPAPNQYGLCFKFFKTESRIVRSTMVAHGFREEPHTSDDWMLQWSGCHIKPQMLRGLKEWQKVNHFPRAYELTRKDKLFKNIGRLRRLHGGAEFDFVPKTYSLPADFHAFYGDYMDSKGPFIVKPNCLSRGRGIYVLEDVATLGPTESCVVSKYVTSPLLVNGLKFDLRLYVLVTSFSPLRAYMYEEGLARFATEPYSEDPAHFGNRFMHLTNYSVNKKNKDKYLKNTSAGSGGSASKWSLESLFRHLAHEGRDVIALKARIDALVVKTLVAAEGPIGDAVRSFAPHPRSCFELFGFDVLIDNDLKPWLMEVNLTPSLSCDSPLDRHVKMKMIADMFTLVGFIPPTLTVPGRGRSSGNPPSRRAPTTPHEATLSARNLQMLREASAEQSRSGGFRCLYPTACAPAYKRYFVDTKFGSFPQQVVNCMFPFTKEDGKHSDAPPRPLCDARPSIKNISKPLSREMDLSHHTTRGLMRGAPEDDRQGGPPHHGVQRRDNEPLAFSISPLFEFDGPLLSALQARVVFAKLLFFVHERILDACLAQQCEDELEESASGPLARHIHALLLVDGLLDARAPAASSDQLGARERILHVCSRLKRFIVEYRAETEHLKRTGAFDVFGHDARAPPTVSPCPSFKSHMNTELLQVVLSNSSEADLRALLLRFAGLPPRSDSADLLVCLHAATRTGMADREPVSRFTDQGDGGERTDQRGGGERRSEPASAWSGQGTHEGRRGGGEARSQPARCSGQQEHAHSPELADDDVPPTVPCRKVAHNKEHTNTRTQKGFAVLAGEDDLGGWQS